MEAVSKPAYQTNIENTAKELEIRIEWKVNEFWRLRKVGFITINKFDENTPVASDFAESIANLYIIQLKIIFSVV